MPLSWVEIVSNAQNESITSLGLWGFTELEGNKDNKLEAKPEDQQSCNAHLRPKPELIYFPSLLLVAYLTFL